MSNRLILLFVSILLIIGVTYILISWNTNNSINIANHNNQNINKILYFGDHEAAFRDACQDNRIYVTTLNDLSDKIEGEIIVIDYDVQNKIIDYSQVRKLIKCNRVYFTNVVNTKIIANELMDQESYDVLISSSEGLRNMVKILKNNQSDPQLIIIGYYAKTDDEFSDFINMLITYE